MRVVSLVPNGTEILFALGAGDQVVGVSHECDHPPAARALPALTGSALPEGLSAAEVDRAVAAQLRDGESLYTLDGEAMARLAPDLVVTQTLCPVCAVSAAQVDRAVIPLPRCPEVLSLDPKRLGDVFDDILRVGDRLARRRQAEDLVRGLRERLERVRRAAAGRPAPRAVALEWLDPPFAAGHWVPEMIAAAGGRDALARPGDPSTRTNWERIAEVDPDVLVAMPCGFDRRGAEGQVRAISGSPGWRRLRAVRAGRVAAVDADGCFSRPGPRLVDGIEELAHAFHGIEL